MSTVLTRGAMGVDGAAGAEPLAEAPETQPLSRAQFDAAFAEQRDRPLNEAEQAAARWRELSAAELAASAPQDPASAPQPGELGYTVIVGGSIYRYDLVQEDPSSPTRTRDLVGPAATQFFSRAFVTDRPKGDPRSPRERSYQDVTLLSQDGTTSTLSQNSDGLVELPSSGFGFTTYNRNDVFLPGGARRQLDQWGTPDCIARVINIANDYATLPPAQSDDAGVLQPARVIQYGDLTTNDSQSPLLESGKPRRHATHGTGDQVDIRYPATVFDLNSFIRSAESWGANNFYYSPALAGQAFFGEATHSAHNDEHRNHLHMGFGRGGR